jgi:hypothetical protein
VEQSKRFLSYKINNTQIKKGDCAGKMHPKTPKPEHLVKLGAPTITPIIISILSLMCTV